MQQPTTLRTIWHSLFALLLLAGATAARAQAPAWQSALTLGQGNTIITATATDATGNVFVAGHFLGTLAVGNTTLTSAGNSDGFVAKYQPATASFTWVVPISGSYFDYVAALAVQGNRIYLTGRHGSSPVQIGPYSLPCQGGYDIYVAKLLDAGPTVSVAWAVSAAGISNEEPSALAVSGTGVFVAGSFGSLSTSFGAITLTSAGSSDGFIAKLVDAGSTATWVWAQALGSADNEVINALAVANSNVYVAGEFLGPSLRVGPSTVLTNSGFSNNDVFVAKLVDTGSGATVSWARSAGGNDTKVKALAVSGPNVYVGGTFSGRGTYFSLANGPYTSNGYDGYLWKLTDAGASVGPGWVQQITGNSTPADDAVTGLYTQGSQVLLTGSFGFGQAIFGTQQAYGPGQGDAFVARLLDAGSTGDFAWVQQAGGPRYETTAALAVSQTKIFVAGYFESTAAQFGSFSLPATGPTAGIRTAFLANLSDQVLPTRRLTDLAGTAVFPNPAHNTVTVRVPAGSGPATVQVLDALGRVLCHYQGSAGQDCVFPLDKLATGIYVLQVQVGEARATHRLAVE